MSHFLFTVRTGAEKSGDLLQTSAVCVQRRAQSWDEKQRRRKENDGGGMTNGTEDRAEKIWRKTGDKNKRNKEGRNFEGWLGVYVGQIG